MDKIKIAFIKFGGLAAGGTEKGLQTIAANLPKDRFEVDYYYCDTAPYIGADTIHAGTDPSRKKYLEDAGINLIEFKVGAKDIRVPTHDWVNTNLWELFDERKYDIVQSARAGHAEYPFTHIHSTPIVDLITLPGMAERKHNVEKVIHISKYQAQTWVQAGGEPHKVEVIPLLTEFPAITTQENLRKELGISNDAFVYGFHQRVDDGIFSDIPLNAYKEVESKYGNKVAFVLMGASNLYQNQSGILGLENFYHVEHSGDYDRIQMFLNTVDVYAHGRKDGETYSMAIAEAMRSSKPVVSHVAPAMGHVETIGKGGKVVETAKAYATEMIYLKENLNYYLERAANAKKQFDYNLSLESNIKRYVDVYEYVYAKYEAHRIQQKANKNEWLDEWLVTIP